MATLEFLEQEMISARAIADDETKPAKVRWAAQHRFWNCVRRIQILNNTNSTVEPYKIPLDVLMDS